MNRKHLYINTFGCQMNVYDSEQIAKGLKSLRYELALSPEVADLIIVNTCSIREKAEQKAFSLLGRLAALKRKKSCLIIGVGGCLAQQEGKRILERLPHVDFVFGTHAIGRLPQIIEQIESKKWRVVDVEMSETVAKSLPAADLQNDGRVTSFVAVMQGCDNFCTYCVVPYVRGAEISRDPESIVKEIRSLVESGVKEVTILGQNVNSYGKKEGFCSFPKLLSLINEINGLLRIRFTTSHTKDLSEDLIQAFKDLDKLCSHIHLPVQSGSNRVLQRMNRKYTRELYLKKIDRLRNFCPDIAITSDVIVGFPGEAGADFKETLSLIKRIEYDSLFAFKYSDRPNAPAASFLNKISEQEKKDRLQELLELQRYFTTKKNEALIGSNEPVLVEGLSKKQDESDTENRYQDVQWTGRTSTNRIVNFTQDNGSISRDKIFPGSMVNIRIEKAFPHSLWGNPAGLKGEECYAA